MGVSGGDARHVHGLQLAELLWRAMGYVRGVLR